MESGGGDALHITLEIDVQYLLHRVSLRYIYRPKDQIIDEKKKERIWIRVLPISTGRTDTRVPDIAHVLQ